MSAYPVLEASVKEILSSIQPLRDDWVKRNQIIADLRNIVQSVESLRGATVEPFGSFLSNLFTPRGDLDISIDLHTEPNASSAGKKDKQILLGAILGVLRQIGGWSRLKYIPNARVPILKFNRRDISCDISIDNVLGQIKSKFLLWICGIDGRFRDMVLLVKEWARAHDINNSKSGTFNSYSLSLLVIFHFQTCTPAILPPLQEIYQGNIVQDITGMRVDAMRQIDETCATNIARFKSDKSRAINRSSLSELLLSFFAKFSGLSLKVSELGVCTFTGKWEARNSKLQWKSISRPVFVEDPFEQPENTARSVSARQLLRISATFDMTYNRLVSGYLSKGDILTTLFKPQISHYVPRTPYTNYYIGRQWDRSNNFPASSSTDPHPRVYNAMNSPAQIHLFQSSLYDATPQQPPQQHQPMWMPRPR